MSEKEYYYFKVTGGAVMAALERWKAKRAECTEARRVIEQEFGANGIYGNSAGLQGLVFPKGNPPPGWDRLRHHIDVYRPTGKTKEGKALRKRLQSLKQVDALQFQTEVLGEDRDNPFRFMDGLSMRYMTFETVGDVVILRVPKTKPSDEWTPPDEFCMPLKTSEYWQIKESHTTTQLAQPMTTETDDLSYYELELPKIIAGVRRWEKREWQSEGSQNWYCPGDQSERHLRDHIASNYRVRLAPVPVVKPWTFNTRPREIVWVYKKGFISDRLITAWKDDGVEIGHYAFVTYDELLAEWLQRDGSPCGDCVKPEGGK